MEAMSFYSENVSWGNIGGGMFLFWYVLFREQALLLPCPSSTRFLTRTFVQPGSASELTTARCAVTTETANKTWIKWQSLDFQFRTRSILGNSVSVRGRWYSHNQRKHSLGRWYVGRVVNITLKKIMFQIFILRYRNMGELKVENGRGGKAPPMKDVR